MSDIKERMNNLHKEITAKKEEYINLSKVLLEGEFRNVFELFPEIKEFGWRQYTSYFCDGDPCEFSVYADADCSISINDEEYYDLNGSEEESEEWFKKATLISNIIYTIDSDTLKDMYGDHVRVIVSRNGITTEDYSEHD